MDIGELTQREFTGKQAERIFLASGHKIDLSGLIFPTLTYADIVQLGKELEIGADKVEAIIESGDYDRQSSIIINYLFEYARRGIRRAAGNLRRNLPTQIGKIITTYLVGAALVAGIALTQPFSSAQQKIDCAGALPPFGYASEMFVREWADKKAQYLKEAIERPLYYHQLSAASIPGIESDFIVLTDSSGIMFRLDDLTRAPGNGVFLFGSPALNRLGQTAYFVGDKSTSNIGTYRELASRFPQKNSVCTGSYTLRDVTYNIMVLTAKKPVQADTELIKRVATGFKLEVARF